MTLTEGAGGVFRIRVDSAGSHVHIDVDGRFDLDGWTVLEDALRSVSGSGAVTVTINMARVTLIDPAVVAALARTRDSRVRVAYENLSRAVAATLQANGAAPLLDVSPN